LLEQPLQPKIRCSDAHPMGLAETPTSVRSLTSGLKCTPPANDQLRPPQEWG